MKSLTVLRIVTAKMEIEAQRKYDELQSGYHLQAQLVSYAGATGIDIRAMPTEAHFRLILKA